MKPLYVPSGKALEFCEFACNLYRGCTHGCKYCYVPKVLKLQPEHFHSQVTVRKDVILHLTKQLRREYPAEGELLGSTPANKGKVLFCFTCDPYPVDSNLSIVTRQAIDAIGAYGYTPVVLTKAGLQAVRDFDLLKQYDGQFAATLTMYDEAKSLEWEPGAPLPSERIRALEQAHKCGIFTWVSLEPVIDPKQTFKLIDATKHFVDHYKVGKLNYRDVGVDWREFVVEARKRLEGKDVYWKRSLLEYTEGAIDCTA